MRIAMSPLTKRVYAGKIKANGYEWKEGKVDVTDDFLRTVVQRFEDVPVFEVDGMKFKVTCERVG